MNQLNNKIWNLIQSNKEYQENLFLFSSKQGDFSIFINEENNYEDINWLYISDLQSAKLVGIDIKTNEIYAIDDEGFLVEVCNGLENIPYEFIRRECSFTNDETVNDYFEKYKDYNYKETLEKYEEYCKDNNIALDKDNVYHDGNGKLFEKYFDK